MDIIERHFAAENAHDVAGTLATYTDDLVWDDVGNPLCPVYGKSAAGEIYEGIIDAIPDLHLESVSRFASGDHVVDESVATGHIEGTFIGIEAAELRCGSGSCTCSTSATASSAASRPGSTRRASSARSRPTGRRRRGRTRRQALRPPRDVEITITVRR